MKNHARRINYYKYIKGENRLLQIQDEYMEMQREMESKEGERREIIQILHTQLLVLPPILSSPL